MRCEECESFLDIDFDDVSIYCWLPLSHSRAKVGAFLESAGFQHEILDGDVVRIDMASSELHNCLVQLKGVLSGRELQAAKAMSLPRGTEPNVATFNRVITLDRLVGLSYGNWVRELIEEQRFTTFFQPMISRETGMVAGYEALFRGKEADGAIVSPAHIFKTAADAGMLFQLDLAARRSAVEMASKKGIKDKLLFINFNPTAIYDPSYCLRTTVSACEELGLSPSQIVFEVTETDEVSDVGHLRGILAFYRNAGFNVALDDIGAGYSGLNLLQDLKPDMVKVDRHLITGIDQEAFKQNIVGHLISMAHMEGIKVVVEGVETPEEAAWLQLAEADIIQGYYFAKPAEDLAKAEDLPDLPISS